MRSDGDADEYADGGGCCSVDTFFVATKIQNENNENLLFVFQLVPMREEVLFS